MPQNQVYIRDTEGNTTHMSPADGIANFLSDVGYRLTIHIDGYDIILRKNCSIDGDVIQLDKDLNQTSALRLWLPSEDRSEEPS